MNENESQANESQGGKSKSKKTALVIVISVVAAAFLLAALNMIDYDALFIKIFRKDDPNTQSKEIKFYEPDFDADILKEDDYLAMMRYLKYSQGPETFTITQGDYASYGIFCQLFGEYFDAMVRGDAEAYNALFTDEYIKNNGPKKPFPMQRVYNMEVRLASTEPYGDNAGIRAIFIVNYMIMQNDGTVRSDVGSDCTANLYFELISNDENKAYINSIVTTLSEN